MEIELDAFSGRPNPRWELTGAQAAEFLARLRALRPTQGRDFVVEDLGYRGFIVRAKGEPVDGFDEVRLYRGTFFARHCSAAISMRPTTVRMGIRHRGNGMIVAA